MPRKSTSSGTKLWRWRTRSNRSNSELEGRELSLASPRGSYPPTYGSPERFRRQQLCSPYLTESAHVLSLQNPSSSSNSEFPPGSTSVSQNTNDFNESVIRLARSDTILRSPTSTEHHTPRGLTKDFYAKAKKGFGSTLRFKTSKQSRHYPTIPECPHSSSEGINYQSSPSSVKTVSWIKEELSKTKFPRKLFGKAPWRRKDSGETASSVASSVREVLRGYTPPATPSTEFTVPSDPLYNQFPGGEAVRIKTPPMCEDTADGKPRGFFTSMTPPAEEGSENLPDPMPLQSSSRRHAHRHTLSPRPREWWERMPTKPIRRDPQESAAAFEFQIPEHLASSPMCPANSRHPSGGTGLCVYHGRRRMTTRLKNVSHGDERKGSRGDFAVRSDQ